VATFAQIVSAADSIAAIYKPLKIILFGSYAYGTPTADSDVDLLVLKNFRGSQNLQTDKVRTSVVIPFPVDLLVRRPVDVHRRIDGNDFFLREILEKGLVLYASDDARVGEESRKRLRRRLAAIKIPQTWAFRYDLLPLPAVH
jgi:predicted nucleotidyltransferase